MAPSHGAPAPRLPGSPGPGPATARWVHGDREGNARADAASWASAVAGREESSTLLGDWYATLLPWRPHQVALLVKERTLLPVLVPLAPAATLLDRLPDHVGEVLHAHRAPERVIAAETQQHMCQARVAPTANRSIVGSMNEFANLADVYRSDYPAGPDLLELSVRLSTVPCGPLYARHVSPDRELAALPRDRTT